MLVDTHCHLFFDEYDNDREDTIKRAKNSGVEILVNVGIDQGTSEECIHLADKYNQVYATVGLHPHSSAQFDEKLLLALEKMAQESSQVKAIGEVGLDYYKCPVPKEQQQHVFRRMIDLATKVNLPLVVHSREAFDDTLNLLLEGQEKNSNLKVLFHCYTYGPEEARKVVDSGFSISFSGIVTFKSAKQVKKAAQEAPLENIMIETDSPYLAPQEHRGQRNEPAYVQFIAKEIAELKGIELEKVQDQTSQNALQFFNIRTNLL